ncbi:MAG: AsmA family protein [Rhodospirillaceae bacterium]|nr:AsmA family protein [Rhodospirillaceae bacterium]
MMSGTARTALVFISVVLVLLGAAALFAPRLIDVRGLSPTIAAELSRALGHDVRVKGEVLLSLVPGPRLIVKDIATTTQESGAFALTAEEARADLSWRDLVLGRYTIARLSLVRPSIETNWNDMPALGGEVPRLSIERGHLSLRGATQALTFESADIELTPSSNGSLSWTLNGLAEGLAVSVTGKLNAPARNGNRNVQATLRLPEADVTLDLSGMVSAAVFTGNAVISALRAADALSVSGLLDLDTARWPWSGQPLAMTANVVIDSDQIAFNSGEAKLGDQAATFSGRAGLGEPTFALVVEVNKADAGTWLPARPANATPQQRQTLATVLGLDREWRGEVKLNAPNMRLGSQTLRDGRLDAEREKGQWNIRDAALTLPGQSRVSFAGLLSSDAESPSVEGSWRWAAQDLRALLAWLDIDAQSVAAGRLSSLSASGTIQASNRLVALGDVAIAFDATQAVGRISFGWDRELPTVIDLDIDHLALDAYWPLLRRAAAMDNNATGSGYGINPLAPWLGMLASQKGTLRAAVQQLTWRDAAAGRLGLDLAFDGGVADIRSLAFEDASGAALWVGGKIRNLDTIPTADSLQLNLKVSDIPRFIRAARADVPPVLQALSPWSMTAALNGSLLDASVAIDGKLGAVEVKARGVAGLVGAAPKLDTLIELRHPDADALRKTMWGAAAPATKIGGAASAAAKLKYESGLWTLDEANVAFGPFGTKARATLAETNGRRSVNVTMSELNLDLTALSAAQILPVPLPGGWEGEVTLSGRLLKSAYVDARDFSARFVATPDAVELAEWNGRLFDGPAQVALKWAKNTERVAHRLQGQIVINGANPALIIDGLPLAPRGQADITLNFEADAQTPQAWLAHASGSGSMKLAVPANTAMKNTGLLAPLSAVMRAESQDAKAAAPVTGSATFAMTNGIVSTTDLAIGANAYAGTFGGSIDLNRKLFDLKGTLRLKDRGLIVGPSAQLVLPPVVPMSVSGPMTAPTIKLDTSGVQR